MIATGAGAGFVSETVGIDTAGGVLAVVVALSVGFGAGLETMILGATGSSAWGAGMAGTAWFAVSATVEAEGGAALAVSDVSVDGRNIITPTRTAIAATAMTAKMVQNNLWFAGMRGPSSFFERCEP